MRPLHVTTIIDIWTTIYVEQFRLFTAILTPRPNARFVALLVTAEDVSLSLTVAMGASIKGMT
jgi:hypothetical protein